ncbi:MAG: outer membrane beta-barrel protein [Deltaproteobacteria bacterium]|nr:outer membrane beta-barrel protein [Deltaproteobacteria bacterium]MCW5801647.1 outer membrane beta-barrel protein [Deltaproteobacteria bacterium]
MTMTKFPWALAVGGLLALRVVPAHADTPAEQCPPGTQPVTTSVEVQTEEEPGVLSYGWHDPRLMSGIGIGVIVGGGITGFTSQAMRDIVSNDVGGQWDARVTIGTHIPIALDLQYQGTAQSLQTLSGFDNGTLIGTALEGMARWNILPHFSFNPYIFGGLGWQNYNVTNRNFSRAATGLASSDNSLSIPLGAGLSWRDGSGLVADLRGTFRFAADQDLLLEPNGSQADLWTWGVSAQIGWEF